MLKRDKIKISVIAILLLLLGGTYFLFGKESIVMKYVAGACLIGWLATMLIVNKKYK